MVDLYGEHWAIPVDANGDGPVEPGDGTREVCIECNKDWPCPSSELITELRKDAEELRERIRRANVYLIRKELTAHNNGMARMALDGFDMTTLTAADMGVSVPEATRATERLLQVIFEAEPKEDS